MEGGTRRLSNAKTQQVTSQAAQGLLLLRDPQQEDNLPPANPETPTPSPLKLHRDSLLFLELQFDITSRAYALISATNDTYRGTKGGFEETQYLLFIPG